ncbi:MAG: glycosyltransferase family 39 protein [Minicystis sp.]
MFIGYHATQLAIDLIPVSRYGVGSPALYHLLFGILPPDHLTMMRANAVMGVLTIPLLATFGARLLADRRAGALFALIAALLPQFIRNDNSDANNVPALLYMMGAAVLFAEHLAAGEVLTLAGAVVLAAFAAMTRPEMPVVVLGVLGTLLLAQPERTRARKAALIAAAAAIVILTLPHVMHVRASSADLKTSLTWGRDMKLAQLPGKLAEMNAVIEPRIYPRALLVLAIVLLVIAPRERRRARVVLALLAALSFVVYVVDIDWANVARVHVPGALWTTLLACAAMVDLVEIARRRLPAQRAAPWVAGAVMAGGIAVTTVPTARLLFAPTNEQTEDDFIHAAVAAMPPAEFILLRPDWDDRDKSSPFSAYTHYFFPDYLFTPPARSGHVMGLGEFRTRESFDQQVYFFAGMRCFAQFRSREVPPPRGDNKQPACAEMERNYQLEEVLGWDVPNRGNVWLDYYGDAPTLHLALYRVLPRRR